ncbi:NAD(P)/FAD-dependent oxidoreductase [Oceaniglobus ichthyenteri]|uniref:NAD(P)/FAD-dependent oxidoreductase n=1 Tax=Oceaniglobus ichthyenteri TaxID=2136177 RepID=UPI000D3C62A1|nr:FAD-binding oxidoreductase [Oceaniglobus ichthyenteri]
MTAAPPARTGDDIFHPDFQQRPFWWDDAPPDDGNTPLPPRVDVAIVGSGYCGLSAGLELARAGLRIAVLDSGQIGEGASTRNGGMVSGGLKLPEKMRRKMGPERFERVMQEAAKSFYYLENFLEKEKFDAQYVRCGRFTGAHSPGAYHRLEAQADSIHRNTGFATNMVPKQAQHQEIGGDFYHGGMVVAESGGLNPARYHRALRQAFIDAGGTLHGHSEVKNIARSAGGFTLQTSAGDMQADQVFVATNGYSGPVWPWLRRRIIPIASYVIATEELSPDLISTLNPKARMLVDTKRILYYFRQSPDGRRIIFGGRASFRNSSEKTSAKSLHRFMCDVWPQLGQTRITHAWKGNVGFSFDMLPHMGSHDGIHFAGSYQGTGVAMATYLGHQSALKMLGRDQAPSVFGELRFPDNPLYHGTPWFLPIVGNYYRARDRFERWTGR